MSISQNIDFLCLLRCGRDSNPRPRAWQARIRTSWTTAPVFQSCFPFPEKRMQRYALFLNCTTIQAHFSKKSTVSSLSDLQCLSRSLIYTTFWYSRAESNRNRRNRNPKFYPLNYGSNRGAKIITFQKFSNLLSNSSGEKELFLHIHRWECDVNNWLFGREHVYLSAH